MSDKDTGERTFETVRARYRARFGSGPAGFLPGRQVSDGDYDWDENAQGGEMNKMVPMGIGGGAGLTLLALALLSFTNAAKWSDLARGGAATGYTLVGFFLTVAGLGAILATWNHVFRAADQPSHH